MGELSFINVAPFNNTNENKPRAGPLDEWREAGEKKPKVSRACFRPRDLEMGADWPRAEPERGPLCGRTTGCDWPILFTILMPEACNSYIWQQIRTPDVGKTRQQDRIRFIECLAMITESSYSVVKMHVVIHLPIPPGPSPSRYSIQARAQSRDLLTLIARYIACYIPCMSSSYHS